MTSKIIEQLRYFFFLCLQFCGNRINLLYQKFAVLFNYPENPGMPIVKPDNVISYFTRSSYPRFGTPMNSIPSNWIECFMGTKPETASIFKFLYYSKVDGYYNFYINTYDNTFFLPDWLSQWLQLHFNIYSNADIGLLETMRESMFLLLLFYMKFVIFRLNLFWFITINPFVRPWVYFTSLVDWSYEITAGLLPGVLGIDMGLVIYLAVIGKLIDAFNCMVFTMPYLPSEGQIDLLKKNSGIFYVDIPDIEFMLGKDDTKEVMFFRYLPQLWYTHPIPNELREFWYYERPDILKYMIENYESFGINFYPDNILSELQQYHILDPYPENIQKLEGLINTTFLNYNDFFIDKFENIFSNLF